MHLFYKYDATKTSSQNCYEEMKRQRQLLDLAGKIAKRRNDLVFRRQNREIATTLQSNGMLETEKRGLIEAKIDQDFAYLRADYEGKKKKHYKLLKMASV